jgi:hypothetical protein
MLLLLHSRPRVNVFGFPEMMFSPRGSIISDILSLLRGTIIDFDIPVSLSVGNGSDTHQTLISTSTPDASSNFMRASTVLLLEL